MKTKEKQMKSPFGFFNLPHTANNYALNCLNGKQV